MNVPTAGRTRIAIVVAAGRVGGYALGYALEDPSVLRVTAMIKKSA